MNLTLTMFKTFLKIYSRDRQAIFFTLLFPTILMLAFGFANSGEEDPMDIGISNYSSSALATGFIANLDNNPLFNVTESDAETLKSQVVTGDLALVLILPENFEDSGTSVDITLLIDAAQTSQSSTLIAIIEQALLNIERDLRNTEPLFSLTVEDVQARSQSYLDFLVPGLLAFTLMQLSISGSGFNIVEYRRKGILKRLFVTPIEPKNFITGLVLARLLMGMVQISALLAIAVFLLDVTIVGSIFAMYLVILLGTVIFLSIGFCLGSIAKTQQAIMALGNLVTFPQIFLSGIFYSVDSLPTMIQPLAKILPLSFVSNGLREIAVNGLTLVEIIPDLIGLVVWSIIALALAIRLFVWKEVAH